MNFARRTEPFGHFSSPPAAAWIDAGILLRRARSAYGQMDFVRHFRDLLIALEAAQVGATLVTENARDFARWKSLLASTRKTLKLLSHLNERSLPVAKNLPTPKRTPLFVTPSTISLSPAATSQKSANSPRRCRVPKRPCAPLCRRLADLHILVLQQNSRKFFAPLPSGPCPPPSTCSPPTAPGGHRASGTPSRFP